MLGALPGQDLTSDTILMEFGVTLPQNLLDPAEGLGNGRAVLGADVQQRQVRLAA
jgi:hypothetical protein